MDLRVDRLRRTGLPAGRHIPTAMRNDEYGPPGRIPDRAPCTRSLRSRRQAIHCALHHLDRHQPILYNHLHQISKTKDGPHSTRRYRMKRHNIIAVLSAAWSCRHLQANLHPNKSKNLLNSTPDRLTRACAMTLSQRRTGGGGKPLSDVVNSALKEARLHTNLTRSNNNQATIPITPARNAGDVFYSPVSTADIHHGHSGIFSRKDMIVHAPGPRRTVEETNYRNVRVASDGQLQ